MATRPSRNDRDESIDIDIDIEVDADVPDAFEEAPTNERTSLPPTDRVEQLRRLALVGMRVAEIAQKLNTATDAILDYANILSAAPKTQPASPRAVAAVQREAERCAELSRRLTKLATASAVLPTRVTADELLRAGLGFAQHESNHDGRVAFATHPPLPMLLVRVHEVAVALGHIIQNALDASEGDGAIALAAAEASRRGRAGITLAVTDSGAGIPSSDLKHIFEPFFTTRGASGHLGLGLAVARAIVDAEGGQIEIDSGAGRGTTVRIWLPLSDTRPPRTPAHSGTRIKRQ